MNRPVRTRFAPSPTGYMHIGGARTALFAWLIARKHGGDFILRIEDTDQKRLVAGSMEHINKSLSWMLGQPQESLTGYADKPCPWDEGPNFFKTNAYDPYVQSSRVAHKDKDGLNIYERYAKKLVEAGRAYVDPYTSEQIQEFREDAQKNKLAFLYRNYVQQSDVDTLEQWEPGCGKPLRLKSKPQAYSWNDEVMGELSTPEVVVDDIILIKSDGYPTYNFAHIVDDDDMEITHIIRGQEFLSSMPNYLNIYEALEINWKQLVFATVPPIMSEQGNKKLSKRDGAKDLLDYQNEGYFSFAICNFLASLGWNDGTEKEFYRTNELIEAFTLDRIQKSGARFDERQAQWYNGMVIRDIYQNQELYGTTLYDVVSPIADDPKKAGTTGMWPESAYEKNNDQHYRKKVLSLVYDRMKFLNDLGGKRIYADQPEDQLVDLTSYFFEEPSPKPELIQSNKQLQKLSEEERHTLLQTAHDELKKLPEGEWTPERIQQQLNTLLEITSQKPGILFSLIRIVTTWAPFSPQLNETLSVIGKEKTLSRILNTLNHS